MEISKVRDLTLIKIDESKTMVVACDSCGGIGMKEHDAFRIPPFYVGKFTARVALMEIICAGAEVITIADAVCNEMNNTGKEIIEGIKAELRTAGIDNIVLTGSTEENFATTSTGLGVTVVGIADTRNLKINNVKKNAVVISIGIPKIGSEINIEADEDIVDYDTIEKLTSLEGIYEIIPVGSKGIFYEVEQLSKNNFKRIYLKENLKIDIRKSAGPSTCIIAAVDENVLEELRCIKNVNIIGDLEG